MATLLPSNAHSLLSITESTAALRGFVVFFRVLRASKSLCLCSFGLKPVTGILVNALLYFSTCVYLFCAGSQSVRRVYIFL